MTGRRTLAALLLAMAIVVPARAEPPFSFETTPGKLPKDVRPVAYRIEITPDLQKLMSADGKDQTVPFGGKEEVDLEVVKPTNTITLNALDLTFASVGVDGIGIDPKDIRVDPDMQTASFRLPSQLAVGSHKLTIAYQGKIIPQPIGIYYTVFDRGRRRMLTTQFEPVDVRRMFPGWDEPVFKASFTLSAVLPSEFTAISNMPGHEQPAGPGQKKVTFDPTPKMSSYLVVLVAGDLKSINRNIANVSVAVNAPSGREQQGRYALEAMEQLLPYYNDYFGVPFPLPKLDLVAIPDFNAGAMENWGGITYLDSRLLFDPAGSSQGTREDVYAVVAHEMAHQWSGDLVTMAWWNNLWLNEGFASWMEKKAADHFNPAWKTWLRANAAKETAMAADAWRTAHPIQQEIADESKMESAFDRISYEKGQSVIRMIEAYLGEQTFRDGMRRYMKSHQYSSATTGDLWQALEQASNQDVAEIVAGFTEYPGIPLIQVAAGCVDGKTKVSLRQDRFTVHNPFAEKHTWLVPVIIGRLDDPKVQRLKIVGRTETAEFDGCGKPVKANVGGIGYYRVAYDEATSRGLIASYGKFPAADRVNLLADNWAMVKAGRADPKSYFDLTKQLSGETELVVWESVIGTLREIDALERDASGRDTFRAYARGLVKPVLDRLGWDPKPDEATKDPEALQLRTLAIVALGRFGDPAVIEEARRRFAAFLQNPGTLHQDLRDAVLTVVGYWADPDVFDTLRNLGRTSTGTEELLRYYFALAGAGYPALVAKTVEIAAQSDELPKGQVDRFLARAASASDDPDRVWRREKILAKLTTSKKQRLLPQIAVSSSSPAVAFQLKWAEPSQASEGARYEAEKAVEEIEFKAEFKRGLLPKLDNWLKLNVGG